MIRSILFCFVAIFFIACGGDSDKSSPSLSQKSLPIIAQKSSDLNIEKISEEEVSVSFDAVGIKDTFVKYYKLIIQRLSLEEKKDGKSRAIVVDLSKDCKKISDTSKECFIEAKKGQKKYNFLIKGLIGEEKYSIVLEACQDKQSCHAKEEVKEEAKEEAAPKDDDIKAVVKNTPPIANAGDSQSIQVNEKITFDGTFSKDEDGTIVKYEWFEGTRFLGEGKTFATTFLKAGTYTIVLKVTDDKNATNSDEVQLHVKPKKPTNILPTAKTKTTIIQNENEEVFFDGSSSQSNDGSALKYEWFKGETLLSNKAKFSKSDFAVGTHTIIFKATNGSGLVDTLLVRLIIKDTTKPLILSASLPNLAQNVHLDSSYVLRFSEAIQMPSKTDITLQDEQDEALNIDLLFTLDSTKTILKIEPKEKLKQATNYTLKIKNIKDMAGNTLETQKRIDFTTLTIPTSAIEFYLQAWDKSKAEIKIVLEIENERGQFELENIVLNRNGKIIHTKNIQKSKQYKITMLNNKNICTSSDNMGKTLISNGDTIRVDIDCKARVSLEPTASTTQRVSFKKNEQIKVWNTTAKLASTQKMISFDKFIYTSGDENIAVIDTNGTITLKKPGRVTISVDVDSRYYTATNTVSYHLEVVLPTSSAIIQDIQMGQTTILSTKDKYHQLAAQKETIIRAYMYAEKAGVKNPPTTITFTTADGRVYEKEMTCPEVLHVGKIKDSEQEGYNYNIADTCYTIMKSDEEKSYITPNVVVRVSTKEATQEITPKISHRRYLNIFLVRGMTRYKVNGYFREYIAQVSDEDIQKIKDFLLDTYPVSEVNIRVRKEPYRLGVILQQALGDLEHIYAHERKPNEYVYAIVPADIHSPQSTIGIGSGLSRVGKGISAGRDRVFASGDDYIKTLAHELGHAFGLYHSPCGIGISQIAPYWRSRFSNNWQNETKGYLSHSPVYIPLLQRVVSPYDWQKDSLIQQLIGQPADLMGYCGGHRLSKHFYKEMSVYWMKNEPQFDSPSYENTNSALSRSLKDDKISYKTLIRGKIAFGKMLLEPISITSSYLKPTFSEENDGYSILIRSNKKESLYPLKIITTDHSSERFFELVLPKIKIDNIKFFYKGKEVPYKIVGLKNSIKPKTTTPKITYDDGIIRWDNSSYQWMRALHVSDERVIVAQKAKGGIYKIDQELKKGILEVSIMDGIHSVVKRFDIH